MDLDWHNTTSKESEGSGYNFILDLLPSWVSDQSAEYQGALIRTSKPGWEWWARFIAAKRADDENVFGSSETKEGALREGMEALDRLIAKHKLGVR